MLLTAGIALANGTHGPPGVASSDNRVAAGIRTKAELHLALDARVGLWHPDGEHPPGIPIEIFAEHGRTPQNPGPLIRVTTGTEVVVTLHNAIPGKTLTMHGFADRPGAADKPATIPFGQTRVIRFRAGAPGTYLYWADTSGKTLEHRFGADSQLNGAIVVDEQGIKPNADRIFVVSDWINVAHKRGGPNFAYELITVNGLAWPHTERLSYKRGDTVHWRWLNASIGDHPLHMHGYYFSVDSRGDGMADTLYPDNERENAVTELLMPGKTFSLTWHADRPGNWLFHCHLTYHTAAHLPVAWLLARSKPVTDPLAHDSAKAETGGLVIAFTVGNRFQAPAAQDVAKQRVSLLVRRAADDAPGKPSFRYIVNKHDPKDESAAIGAPIFLTQGVPAAIDVTNSLSEPTSVHWHGIELQDSYYDGVTGFSGFGNRLAPAIKPGETFEARFTPRRAGTFIYHTHFDDVWQLRAGLAGPLIILASGETYEPAWDHIFTITTTHTDEDLKILINGLYAPPALTMRAGVPQRFRFLNVTTFWTEALVSLSDGIRTVQWRPLAVDGMNLSAGRRRPGAAVATITIGQTRDFTFTPAAPGELVLQFWPDAQVPNIVSVPVHVIQ